MTDRAALDIAALLAEPVAIQRRLLPAGDRAVERARRVLDAGLGARSISWSRSGRFGADRALPGGTFSGARVLSIRGPRSRRHAHRVGRPATCPCQAPSRSPKRAVAFARKRRGPSGHRWHGGAGHRSAGNRPWPLGIESDLVVRAWQPGGPDAGSGVLGPKKRCRTCSSTGKMPRSRRHQVPIVTDAEGRIVWVAGVALGRGLSGHAGHRSPW